MSKPKNSASKVYISKHRDFSTTIGGDTFHFQGKSGSTYITDDPEKQTVLEDHPDFGRDFWLAGENDKVKSSEVNLAKGPVTTVKGDSAADVPVKPESGK